MGEIIVEMIASLVQHIPYGRKIRLIV